MAKKPMWIIKRIQKYLDEGYEVILRKDSDGAHQVSYSRVVRIEWKSIRRTMFEALSVSETYDYKPGKYSVSALEENERVTFFWKGKLLDSKPKFDPEDEDEDAFIDNDEFDDERDEEDDEDENTFGWDINESCKSNSRHRRLKKICL